ncbi:MAG: DNA polymerase III subunit delta [Gaiellales bacterium]
MAPELKPAYLIAGSDWPKVDAATARLRARFAEESVEQITVGGEHDADVVAACNALGLLGGPRLVLVRGAEELDEPRAAAIVDYLRSPTPDTCLALFGGAGIDSKGALAKAVEAVGDVRFFDAPDRKQAVDWVVKRFADLGVRCPPGVARRLVERAGEDTGELALEVEKVATYAGAEQLEPDDVDALVPAASDVKPWEITDAWGRRDGAAMIALALADLDRADEVSRLVATLSAHVRKVRRAASLVEAGAGQADVAKQLGLKPYPAQKLVAQARQFELKELSAAIVRLADLDMAVKGASRMDSRFELELALADIAGE